MVRGYETTVSTMGLFLYFPHAAHDVRFHTNLTDADRNGESSRDGSP